MQRAKFPVGDGGAADLLGAIGVWSPHDNIKLRQMGLTREFSPELEVQPAPPLPDAPAKRIFLACSELSAQLWHAECHTHFDTGRPQDCQHQSQQGA